ncbi:MAG: rhodanese-like domain-containing protein [Alkalicoccus sp.]|uniref:Rhodanese-like domain-containing protein n=1 Tax=Alkalicoccus sp. TaxID=2005376 RepID=A0A651DQN5_9BACI|nr:MAG: rhodanese-like domain-containing protein [Alkalicoccus sp.]
MTGMIAAGAAIFMLLNSAGAEEEISTKELEEKLAGEQADDYYFVDVREPDEFEEGHIAQMENYPLSTLSEDYASLPQDKPMVIICRSGNRSEQAVEFLEQEGFDDLINVEGGMLDWEGETVQ